MLQFKIAVIDDQPEIAKEETQTVIRIAKELQIPAQAQMYIGAEDFLCDFGDESCDLYILDIVMPDKSGMELARMIREKNAEVPIIFLTDYKQYAIEGYEVRALRYLLKSEYEEQMRKILPMVYEEWKKLSETYYQYTYRNSIEPVAFRDILYVYMDGRQPVIKSKIKDYYERKPLKEIHDELNNGLFVVIRKNCIVNLENVKYFEGNTLHMIDGKELEVSRKYKPSFRQRLIAYMGQV